ncbi:6-phosphogluconolactonase [Magnetofaba australis]|uniref:6-phosphogluconolactonase n=1 Tax=Magnetofaba australis IT-1 TaxID=1434232 RepID=A0A1Y2JZ32_9PROT|nr:6-phosphogluconolactonase [Magnetofaba australis]OSM00158.1 putative 6-phosphogluconolactonase [Magnetofaba australis IT-1]
MTLPACVDERRFPDVETADRALAEAIAKRLRSAVEQRGQASLIVPGGRSPQTMLRVLGEQPLTWSAVRVTVSDERFTSADSPDNNCRQMRKLLMQGPAAVAEPIPLIETTADPQGALAAAQANLARFPWPADVTVLGLGAEGYVGSLFPGNPALSADYAEQALAVAARSPTPPHPRIALSPHALLMSRWIVLMVVGPEKAEVYRQALACGDPSVMPVCFLFQQQDVAVSVWLIDKK